MKSLGRTNNGGYIIEMSQDEFTTFLRLQSTINGHPYYFGDNLHRDLDGTDLSKVLTALDNLFQARSNIQFLKDSIDSLDSLLGTIVKEEKE